VAIQELRKWKGEFALDKPALEEALNFFGDEAARHLETALTQAVADHCSVIALTHVPPFKEAAWHEGKHSDDNYLPHFACKATGDVFRRVMGGQPQSSLLVLCGHTHGQGETQIAENHQVLTCEAEYGNPVIQQVFDIE
jgi:Icc protein